MVNEMDEDKTEVKYDEFDLQDAHDEGYDEGWDDGYITAITHMKNLMGKCNDKASNPHEYHPNFVDEIKV